jgi:hypothetical protein
MKRFMLTGFLFITVLTPVIASSTPFYAGLQVNNNTATGSLGYQINKVYAVEAYYSKSEEHISHSGIASDSNISAAGLSALAMLPMKLVGGSAYYLFFKAGYERSNKEESYSIPSSVTLTLPYKDTVTSSENHALVGVGAQYDFYQNLSGRAGIESVGDKRSVYLSAILKF